MKCEYKWIANDLFDVAKRLKQINKGYAVRFNLKTTKYEVTFLGEVAFVTSNLNCETVKKAHRSNVRNFDEIVREMNTTNERLELNEQERLMRESKLKLSDLLRYNQA